MNICCLEHMRLRFSIVLITQLPVFALAQISPGPLASVHSHLEGMSNCTNCHTLGAKVTDAKCLDCHKEVKSRIDQNKGYHVSADVRVKSCVTCHSDHHGLTFQIIRFNQESFNHNLTGYTLLGAHSKKACKDCHKADFISNNTIKKKKFTFLGLTTGCTPCHADYHQQTLSVNCSDCHGFELFKPAGKFNHINTRFQLTGKHKDVPCVKCHAITERNGTRFQVFAGIQYGNCTSCHADVHQNKFGQNCTQCHSTESFHSIKGMTNFDHSKTNFKLEGKHQNLACAKCHKTNLTDPIKHGLCTDCHPDYHNKQFTVQGVIRDCSDCHSIMGFTGSSFTIEQHNKGKFQLQGAHLATPCFECHKKTEKWSFREIGIRCADCHENIHEPYISKKYYPESNCTVCHNESRWNDVTFDHSKTTFSLSGAHAKQTCRTCHFNKNATGHEIQHFSDLASTCSSCHTDIHYQQFENNGVTDCQRCHNPDQWKIENFDHNTTAFKLDGTHKIVACAKCHKNITKENHTFVLYKIKEWKCENCH